jgi:alpha-L-rhamnosidase
LSWTLTAAPGARDQKQTAYQILVASAPGKLVFPGADLRDGGRILSSDRIHVVYRSRALPSRMRCYWKVRVWDGAGKPSAWSETVHWSMGLLDKSDWGAQWIGGRRGRRQPAGQRAGYNRMRPATIGGRGLFPPAAFLDISVPS